MEEIKNKPFLSPEEFRQLLPCSRAVIYEAIRQGKIRSFRLGKRYFIPSSEVDRLSREAGADKDEVTKTDLW
jgi:excisionase family DNA binding protein